MGWSHRLSHNPQQPIRKNDLDMGQGANVVTDSIIQHALNELQL